MTVIGTRRPSDDPRFLLLPWLYLALPLPPLTPRPSLRGGRGGLGGLAGGTTGADPAFQSSAYCCPPPEPLASSSVQMERSRGGKEEKDVAKMQMEGKVRENVSTCFYIWARMKISKLIMYFIISVPKKIKRGKRRTHSKSNCQECQGRECIIEQQTWR